jgi:hypothetical protein
MGSFPEGDTFPKMRSDRAGPVIVPNCQANKTESTYGRIGSRSSDLPAYMTATIGLPVL